MRMYCLPVVCLLALTGAAWAVEFHVAPGGSDAAAGTAARPLATLAGARDAVRAWRAGGKAEAVTVWLHGGTYRLAAPVVFGPQDSGTEKAPVTYAVWRSESVVISGGVEVGGWRKQDERLWVAEVPWAKERPEGFTQLFVNGVRRPRARTPNEGTYAYSQRLQLKGSSFPQCSGLTFREGDLQPWDAGENALVCLFHNWVNSYNRVGEADWSRRRLKFTRPAGIFFLGPSVRYYVENLRSALDAPGEWYLDHKAGLLHYYPAAGEDMAKAEVIAPALRQTLVQLRGAPEVGLYCENLQFRGLSFQHTEADLSADYTQSVQGAHTQRGAIFATGARNCVIEDCEFTRLGEHAVTLREACSYNTISRCHVHDMGGGGVYLSEGAPASPPERYLVTNNKVDNNFIHDGGKVFRAGCGVFLGGAASYNQITHNEICDMSWIGVHMGWSWTGREPTYSHHNEVAYNHIHHIGNGVLNDIGGIYTLGVSPGTVLHHNLIHDVTRFQRGEQGYGGWGIYLDAGSSEILVENNVVYNTRDGGLHLHCYGYPYGDTIRNNVFAFSDEAQLMRNANDEPDEGLHATIERNIVYNANPRMLWGSNWAEKSKLASDYNCYFSEAAEGANFNGKPLAEWQATGRDGHSIVADPGFVNPEKRDFTLRPGSPALAIGFKPIDMKTVGLYGAKAWTERPGKITHRVYEVAPPPEQDTGPIVHDFEDYEAGDTPVGATPSDGAAHSSVSDQQPAAGVGCLRMVDGESEQVWNPHWYTYRTAGVGMVRLQCSVRNDVAQPMECDLEFRDWPTDAGVKYATGPHLWFLPNGVAQAGDGAEWREVGRVPPGEWVEVEVEFAEGEGRAGTYSVRVGKGAAPVTGLKFRQETFIRCNWVGFAGMGKTPGTFYVDEIVIQ